jgi:hypothetical protein
MRPRLVACILAGLLVPFGAGAQTAPAEPPVAVEDEAPRGSSQLAKGAAIGALVGVVILALVLSTASVSSE